MLKQMDAFESQLTHTYSRKLRGGPEGPESLLSEDKPARCITPRSLRRKHTCTHIHIHSKPNPVDSVLGIAIWIITAVLKKGQGHTERVDRESFGTRRGGGDTK